MFTKKITYLKEKLISTAIYVAMVCIFYFLDISCLFLTFTKIPCPGCGMTRAILAALRLDFKTAFHLHPMFWSLPLLYLYFLFDDGLFANKYIDKILLYFIGFGFVLQWVLKIAIL